MCESVVNVGVPDSDKLIDESATAFSLINNVAAFEQRTGTLRERGGVAKERLATFVVTVPNDVQDDEIELFRKYVAWALDVAVNAAVSEVKYTRTWGDGGHAA
jgi:hypothetical protein